MSQSDPVSVSTTPPPPVVPAPGRLSLTTRLAFGAGDFSPGTATLIISFFQLFFLTTVAGLDAGAAGAILFVARIWDAFTDPVMGWLTDRTRSPYGRRRPWLLFGAVPFGLVFFLQWVIPPGGDAVLIAYYTVAVILMSTAFTVVGVPYTALTPELSDDYNERTTLNSFRFAFSIGGSLLGLTLHQTIVGLFPDVATGYLVAGMVLGLLMVMPFLWCFFGVRERFNAAASGESLSVWQQVTTAFRNRPYLFVIGIYLCSWLAVQITTAVLPFYITFWLQRPDLQLPMILTVMGSTLVFLFVWGAVSARTGKRVVYIIGATLWIGVQGFLFFVQPGQIALAFGLAALAGVGVATAYLVPWSMMPDVIDYDELESGQRREGIYYGFMVFAQKAGLGIGLFLVGVALANQGFVEEATSQPASALLAIRLMIGPAPTLLLLVGLVLVWLYPLTRTRYAAIRAALDERHAAHL